MSTGDIFLKKPYAFIDGQYIPLVDVQIKDQRIAAIADTGCIGCGFVLDRRAVASLNLGDPVSAEPVKIAVADGHQVAADVYAVEVTVEGEKQTVELYAVDTAHILGSAPKEIAPLLGHGFMQNYVACFRGKSRELELSK